MPRYRVRVYKVESVAEVDIEASNQMNAMKAALDIKDRLIFTTDDLGKEGNHLAVAFEEKELNKQSTEGS